MPLISSVLIIIYRSVKGVDFIDTSWYVAEPYLVAKGAVPYLNSWSQVPGFTIPLANIIKMYEKLNNGTEGIFLFSAIFYVIWLVVIGCIILFMLKKNNPNLSNIILIPFLFITPHYIFTVNYNSIGVVYLALVATILFSGSYNTNSRKDFIKGAISGIIMARAVIGTPYVILACFIFAVYLFFDNRKDKFYGYAFGGGITAIFVISNCCIQSGFKEFGRSLGFWLNDSAYFKVGKLVSAQSMIKELLCFLFPFLLSLIVLYIIRKLVREIKIYEKIVYFYLIGCVCYGIIHYVFNKDLNVMLYWCWFETLLLTLFLPQRDSRKQLKNFSIVILAYVVTFLFSSFGNIYGFSGRGYWLLIPVIVTFVSFIWGEEKTERNVFYYKCIKAGVYIFSLILIVETFSHVYQEKPIKELTYRVESGIWKGMYTTEEKAKEIVELESIIKKMTKEEEKILFMDWASFGYLMSNGKACTPSALDNMSYLFKVNNSAIMYDYFKVVESIPDKIIYIDFELTEKLSIEDENWKFNMFVDEYYNLTDNFETEMFKVLCYKIKENQSEEVIINEYY